MNQIQRKNPFWSLAGPLLAYFGIQLAVQTVIQAVIRIWRRPTLIILSTAVRQIFRRRWMAISRRPARRSSRC